VEDTTYRAYAEVREYERMRWHGLASSAHGGASGRLL